MKSIHHDQEKLILQAVHSNKFLPVIFSHLKKDGRGTRELWILFLCKLLQINTSSSFRNEVIEQVTSLPYTTWSYKRMIYLEFINIVVDYISKKLFWIHFLDSYFMLSKDKWANIIIKFCLVTPKIFRKVSYDDSRNKERIINILKSMKDNDKNKWTVRDTVEQTYAKLLNLRIISIDQK